MMLRWIYLYLPDNRKDTLEGCSPTLILFIFVNPLICVQAVHLSVQAMKNSTIFPNKSNSYCLVTTLHLIKKKPI